MSAQVLPLRRPDRVPTPSVGELVARVRALAAEENKTKTIRFNYAQYQLRVGQRGPNMRLILETVRQGEPTGKPTVDNNGDWLITLRRTVAGTPVQVVVTVKEHHIVLMTAR